MALFVQHKKQTLRLRQRRRNVQSKGAAAVALGHPAFGRSAFTIAPVSVEGNARLLLRVFLWRLFVLSNREAQLWLVRCVDTPMS